MSSDTPGGRVVVVVGWVGGGMEGSGGIGEISINLVSNRAGLSGRRNIVKQGDI